VGNNGTDVGGNLTLFQTYQVGAIPSMSYGLHVGSVEPNVTGSLVLGGYDSSRCLTDPVVSSFDTVQLRSVALNVSSGGYAYLNTDSAYISDLLRANGTTVNNLPVHPRPGAPHLYLPKDTCDAIASHLPVTYSSEFNLYIWNTKEQAYKDIVSSPHHLAFTLASDNGDESTISVPFALLNLTLTSPIVSSATQYFPCKPWTPVSTGYTLGSAFLQSAFLAQNWQENKIFLAQAPGPDFLDSSLSTSIQKIGYTDTTLTPAKNPPSWEDSWSSTLKALPARLSSAPTMAKHSSAVSGGTIAGIVVGVIAGLATVGGLVWFFMRRRKQNTVHGSLSEAPNTPLPHYHANESGVPYLGKPAMAPYEAEAEQAQISELGTGRDVAELPAKEPEKPPGVG
jgi:hypothetical protein